MISEKPNFTILLDGCESNCDFCTYKRQKLKVNNTRFALNLLKTLEELPKQFKQISISGGEPTESSMLPLVLRAIKEAKKTRKLDRVVLTTNGSKLKEALQQEDFSVINHVNISRHSWEEETNAFVFKNKNLPTKAKLKVLIEKLEGRGIDTTLNICYNTNPFNQLLDFIDFAKEVSASAICFRFDCLNPQESPLFEQEVLSKYPEINRTECSSCRSIFTRIKGLPVYLKTSQVEPSKVEKEITELIYQPSGDVTIDWGGKILFDEDDTESNYDEDNEDDAGEDYFYTAPTNHCGRQSNC